MAASKREQELESALRVAAPYMHDALRLAEWGNYDAQVDLRSCPVCAGSERTGHTGDCKLTAALSKANGEELGEAPILPPHSTE